MKKIVSICMLFVLMFCAASCSAVSNLIGEEETTTEKAEIQSVEFVNKEITLKVGDKSNLLIKENINDSELDWISSDSSIAEVENGVVTAISKGTTTITVKYKEYTDTCIVTVKEKTKKTTKTEVKTSIVYKEKYVTQPDNYDDGTYWLATTSIQSDMGGEAYLSGFSEYEIQCMINEILARNHYKFHTTEWFNYFSNYSWYTYNTSDMATAESRFNSIERENYNYLANYRNNNF